MEVARVLHCIGHRVSGAFRRQGLMAFWLRDERGSYDLGLVAGLSACRSRH